MPLVSKAFGDIITFTRASTGTYFDSAGVLQSAAVDQPRFDYDPSTLAAQGLLIEEARTNLLTYSEDLTQSAWTTNSVAVTPTANQAIAPDGNTTADIVVPTAVSSIHVLRQFASVTSGTTYSGSWFVKAAGYSFVQITLSSGFDGGGALYRNFNLSTGANGNGNLPASQTTISSVGNGWYRITVTAASTLTTVSGRFNLNVLDADTASANPTYTGDGTSGLYIWGAQLEAGAFPTSYIPTTVAQVTRDRDEALVNTLSPWYNATGSTIYAEWVRNAPVAASDFPRGVDFINTSTTDKVSINHLNNQTSSTSQALYPSGLSWPYTSISGLNPTLGVKTAIAFQVGSARYAVNGTLGGSDYALASIPTLDQVVLGSGKGFLSNSTLNGWLRRVTYYPRRLSNAELVSITT